MKAYLLAFVLVAGSTVAQESDETSLDASYLDAPTAWCPADSGVPVILEMDGPNIVDGPQKPPRTIRENRGGNVNRIDVGTYGDSFWSEIEVDPTIIGRFSAKLKICHGLWQSVRVDGSWQLVGMDGLEKASGTFDRAPFYSHQTPFFRSISGPESIHFAKFDDQFLYTLSRPVVTTSQTFAAEPNEE